MNSEAIRCSRIKVSHQRLYCYSQDKTFIAKYLIFIKHIKWKPIQIFFVPNLHRCFTKAEEMEINIAIIIYIIT